MHCGNELGVLACATVASPAMTDTSDWLAWHALVLVQRQAGSLCTMRACSGDDMLMYHGTVRCTLMSATLRHVQPQHGPDWTTYGMPNSKHHTQHPICACCGHTQLTGLLQHGLNEFRGSEATVQEFLSGINVSGGPVSAVTEAGR